MKPPKIARFQAGDEIKITPSGQERHGVVGYKRASIQSLGGRTSKGVVVWDILFLTKTDKIKVVRVSQREILPTGKLRKYV